MKPPSTARRHRDSFRSSGSHGRSRSQVPQDLKHEEGPISVPIEEEKKGDAVEPKYVDQEEAAYMKKASGMG